MAAPLGFRAMRADIDVNTLLKVILVLVVVMLVLRVIDQTVNILASILGPAADLLGLIIVVLIILWLLDRL